MVTGASQPLRVLVVEDETLMRWSITETLAERGHSVLEASSASTALGALHETSEPVDVVLLDFRLPDSNGLGLLADIRRMSPESAVVMMTAYGTPEMAQGALDLGACTVLSKPFDMHRLESLVREAAEARSRNGTPPPVS